MLAALAAAVFAAAFALDYCYAQYSREIGSERPRPHHAAAWSVAVYAASALGFVAAIRVDLLMMIPEVLGLYAGTWYAARRARR